MTEFSDDLLLAIGCWQNGWQEDQSRRLEIGADLERQSNDLDPKFRTVDQLCYRKRFIMVDELVPFVMRELIEGPASWTLDPKFAEKFKGIERDEAFMGTIFSRVPSAQEVVVNLDALWRDTKFLHAVSNYIDRGCDFSDALRNFKGQQREVVLHSPLLPEDIFAISGRSSGFDELCEQAGVVDEYEKDAVWKALIDDHNYPNEPMWINQERSLRVLNGAIDQFSALIDRHKATRKLAK